MKANRREHGMAQKTAGRPEGIMFRSCGPCRGRGHIEVRVECPACQGQGTVDLPVTKAARDVLDAYQLYLDGEHGALDGLRDSLTELKEAAGL
jgi:hypothetical protein